MNFCKKCVMILEETDKCPYCGYEEKGNDDIFSIFDDMDNTIKDDTEEHVCQNDIIESNIKCKNEVFQEQSPKPLQEYSPKYRENKTNKDIITNKNNTTSKDNPETLKRITASNNNTLKKVVKNNKKKVKDKKQGSESYFKIGILEFILIIIAIVSPLIGIILSRIISKRKYNNKFYIYYCVIVVIIYITIQLFYIQ